MDTKDLSIEELRAILLTHDGKGVKIKEFALEELIARAENKTWEKADYIYKDKV